MIRRTLCLFTAVELPPQQRLFTGALFNEEINDALYGFAHRHSLKSNVWVPTRWFEASESNPYVYILPDANLCDLSFLVTSTRVTGFELENGCGRIVVNASQTSNPALFTNFASQSSQPNVGGAGRGGFPCPVSVLSIPYGGTAAARAMQRMQAENSDLSDYWIRWKRRTSQFTHFINASYTSYPGRFNQRWCVDYQPRTMTGDAFPPDVAVRMRQRAVEMGYVSRLWVTVHEATTKFGVRPHPTRIAEAPPLYSSYFTGGIFSLAYHCMDQFETDDSVVFLSHTQLKLAATGVRYPHTALRPFPLLHRVHYEDAAGNFVAGALSSETVHTGRSGAAAAAESIPHEKYRANTAMLDHIRIFGEYTIDAERRLVSSAEKSIRMAAILKDFKSPIFFPVSWILRLQLRVRPNETCVVHPARHRVGSAEEVYVDALCLYNITQLTEPLAALELFFNYPYFFLTDSAVGIDSALVCARIQIQRRLGNRWVPLYILSITGWRLRAGALGVPYVPKAKRAIKKLFSSDESSFFNLDDVLAPDGAIAFMQQYRPVDMADCPFFGSFKVSLCLRAWERGYTSPRWVCLRDPLYAGVFSLRPRAAEVRQGVLPLRADRHLGPDTPGVTYYSLTFFNEEELVRVAGGGGSEPPHAPPLPPPSPLSQKISAERLAKTRCHKASRQAQGYYGQGLMEAFTISPS